MNEAKELNGMGHVLGLEASNDNARETWEQFHARLRDNRIKQYGYDPIEELEKFKW